MKAYLISGLGADKRIFSKLIFNSKVDIVHIEWIVPEKNESLANYANRLSATIDQTNPFIIVGVSFGGMIAVEIAKILKPIYAIVISTSVFNTHLPLIYKLAGKLKIINFIPAWLIKSSNSLTRDYYFGTKSNEEKALLTKIIDDTDPFFLKWAIGSILNWKNTYRPEKLYHIHGTKDKILYSEAAKPDFIIKNGTHFMVYQNAAEISSIIEKIISGKIHT